MDPVFMIERYIMRVEFDDLQLKFTVTMSPAKLPSRKIGDADVPAISYGAMGIAAAYGDVLTEDERFKVRLCSDLRVFMQPLTACR